jgi:hypothetical protein
MKTLLIALLLLPSLLAQPRTVWRAATSAELEALLPARAPVDKERIETEMRTATGIVNNRGQSIAAVVLITAGYAADGKYSHYLLTQHTITLDGHLILPPGAYVVGWTRTDAGLLVHLYDAANGDQRGTVTARALPQPHRIESFRIWPPGDQRMVQIGRFMIPYTLPE